MMIAPAIPGRLPVNLGAAAKLAGAPDQRAFQQAMLVQIQQQHGQALVQLRALPAHRLEVILVRIPAAGVIDDNIGDAGFDHAPGGQAVLAEGVAAIAVAQFRLLLGEIEHLAAFTQNQVIRLLSGFVSSRDLRAGGHGIAHRVHAGEQFAPLLLPIVGDAPGDDPFHLEAVRVRVAAGGKRL